MLVHSNNLYAETFLRTIGYEINGVGSTSSGVRAIEYVLHRELGLQSSNIKLYDGSGLSLDDRLTTAFITSMLTEISHSRISKQFKNALAVSGQTGTIAYRMNNVLLGKVYAKTGTVEGASALAGYMKTKKNHNIGFAIMLNDLDKNQRYNARKFQDAVAKVFYKYM